MAVQIGNVPLGRFVQQVTSRYARYVHHRRGGHGHLFEHHHGAVLVQRSRYLLSLIRSIHLAPVRAGLATEAQCYPWTGHHAYLGNQRIPWLTTHVAHGMLSNAGLSYPELMAAPLDVPDLFERGPAHEPRALGDDAFVSAATGRVVAEPPAGALDEIIQRVVRAQGVALQSVLSPSRRRQHVLARAVITWEAMHAGIATLTEIAARLERDPSTLWTAVERYRALSPELFLEPSMPDLVDPSEAGGSSGGSMEG